MKKIVGLQSWGQREKGWPDVPYHWLIAPDGRILQGRDMGYEPESNTRYDLSGHVGVHLWGDFERQRPTEAQLRSLVRLLAWLCDDLGVDPGTIQGHRDVAPGQTTCPGRDLYRYLEDGTLISWVRAQMRGEAPLIQLGAPLVDGPTTLATETE
jgi:hypothetical protein